MDLLERFLKPVIIAIIMFFSARYLGATVLQASALSLIPLILGILNILASLGYSVTVIALVAAIFSFAVPAEMKVLKGKLQEAVSTSPQPSTTIAKE